MAEEKKEVSVQTNKLVADFNNGIYGSSDNYTLACKMAKGLASSTVVPLQYQNNEANCLVAIEMSNRLNISPLQVMQSLDVINGNPAWKGKTLIAFINNSHKYDEDLHFEYEEKNGEAYSCYAWTKLNGTIVKGTKYTIDMAKKAGLLEKKNSHWLKEPDLMLAYRAVSRFASLNCPEISLGIYTTDELNEIEINNKRSKKLSLNELLKDEDVIEVESKQVNKEDM